MRKPTCGLCVMVFVSACGSSSSDSGASDLAAALDGGSADLARASGDDGGGGNFTWPNGEPTAKSLYFRGTCVSGNCEYPPYDKWWSGALAQCTFDGIALELTTVAIPMGADLFSLRFEVGASPKVTLPAMGTRVDWSLPDGASSFSWVNDDNIPKKSSGTVVFERCGAEVAGRFELKNLCEHHTCASPEAWFGDLVGAFRCKPAMAVNCGL